MVGSTSSAQKEIPDALPRGMDVVDHAVRMHALGMSIIPIKPGAKKPTLAWRKYQAARAALKRVEYWLKEKWPGINYAIVCGKVSGVVAIEADDEEAVRALHEKLPPTPLRQRSRKGEHWLYRHPGDGLDTRNRVRCRIGGVEHAIDIRGDGGYVLGPGSRHPTGHVYAEIEPWTSEALAAAPVFDPAWFDPREPKPKEKASTDARSPTRAELPPLNARQRAARRWLGTGWHGHPMPGTQEGSGRAEKKCFRLANQLVHGFALSPEEALPLMLAWGRQPDQLDEHGDWCPWTRQQLRHKLEDAAAKSDLQDRPDGYMLSDIRWWPSVTGFVADYRFGAWREAEMGPEAERVRIKAQEVQCEGLEPATQEPKAEEADPPKKEEDTRTRRGYRPRDLLALPPPRWLIDQHIPLDSIVLLFGAAGSGKTFVALDMTMSVAAGVPFLGLYDVRKERTVYVAAEGRQGLSCRLQAWSRRRQVELPDDALVIPSAFDLLMLGEAQEILDIVKHDLGNEPVGLLVVDTLARNFGGGDENAPKDMNRFVNNVANLGKALGGAVLVVHHTGQNEAGRERGHSALRGAADAVLGVEKSGRIDAIVSCRKMKDAAEWDPYILTGHVVDLGGGRSSLAFTPQDATMTRWRLLEAKHKDFVVAVWRRHNLNPFARVKECEELAGQIGVTARTLDRWCDLLLGKAILLPWKPERDRPGRPPAHCQINPAAAKIVPDLDGRADV